MKNSRWITKTEFGLLLLSALFLCLMVGILYRTEPHGTSGVYTISTQSTDQMPETEGMELLNINTATAEQLDTLPGIGPVLAERIIAYREENGPFASVEELKQVDGIGDVTLEEFRNEITLEERGEEMPE